MTKCLKQLFLQLKKQQYSRRNMGSTCPRCGVQSQQNAWTLTQDMPLADQHESAAFLAPLPGEAPPRLRYPSLVSSTHFTEDQN